jgi:hypothetical protein
MSTAKVRELDGDDLGVEVRELDGVDLGAAIGVDLGAEVLGRAETWRSEAGI